MWKEKRFNVFSATLWAKQKVILISLTPRDYHLQFIVSCLRPIKLSTLFSHELLAFISVSRHFWSHHPNKACLFLISLVTLSGTNIKGMFCFQKVSCSFSLISAFLLLPQFHFSWMNFTLLFNKTKNLEKLIYELLKERVCNWMKLKDFPLHEKQSIL